MIFRSKNTGRADSGLEVSPHRSLPAEIELCDPRIEAYLDQVLAGLPRSVPAARRIELRRELAAHLEALAEARQELEEGGDSVAAALRQFGSPRSLARSWSREWKRSEPERSPRTLAATAVMFLYLVFSSAWIGVMAEHHFGFSGVVAGALGGLLPAAVGAAWALRNRRPPYDNRLPLGLFTLAVLLSVLVPGEPSWPHFWAYALTIRMCTWSMGMLSGAGLATSLALRREALAKSAVTE